PTRCFHLQGSAVIKRVPKATKSTESSSKSRRTERDSRCFRADSWGAESREFWLSEKRRCRQSGTNEVFSTDGPESCQFPSSEALRPVSRAAVDGEDHDVGFLDGIRSDEGRIRKGPIHESREPGQLCPTWGRRQVKLLNAS